MQKPGKTALTKGALPYYNRKDDNIRHTLLQERVYSMDNQERHTVKTVFIVAGLLAALAAVAVTLYRSEQRVRRLFYLLEQRLNTKSKAFEVEF